MPGISAADMGVVGRFAHSRAIAASHSRTTTSREIFVRRSQPLSVTTTVSDRK